MRLWFPQRSAMERELVALHGQLIQVLLTRGNPMPNCSGISGRVLSVRDGVLRVGLFGNVFVVPVHEIWCVLQPSETNQEIMEVSAVAAGYRP